MSILVPKFALLPTVDYPHKIVIFLLMVFLMSCADNRIIAQSKNGFDLREALIPMNEIISGGPPRDGIPAIDHPKFTVAAEADYLKAFDRVLGIVRNGIAKAYPIRILNWHEIVNDKFGDEPVVITYCPLCGSGVAYLAIVGGEPRTFGVSGLLYNNDVLLYDRETESLWSQILSRAVSGHSKRSELQMIPLLYTTWADWKKRHPESVVLSTNTGFSRDYGRDPYGGYEESERIMFPLAHRDNRYNAKEVVLGVEVNDKYIAFPFSELEKAASPVKRKFNGTELIVNFDAFHESASVTNTAGEVIPGIILYWFAWVAFHPDTEVFTAEE